MPTSSSLLAAALVVGIAPDLQNYVSEYRGDVPPIDRAVAAQQLAAMADYFCEQHPDFVVQVGDLTDSTGGPTGADSDDDDSRTAWGGANEAEWRRVRTFFDRLDACGVPWFVVTGNHDSFKDFERWFPAAEFMSRPWAHSVLRRVEAVANGVEDTEQRAAVFSTPLGPVCVLGLDFQMTVEDREWALVQLGCEADLPTMVVRHASPAFTPFTTDRRVFAFAEGHWIQSPNLNARLVSRAGMPGYMTIFANWQEIQQGGARGAGWVATATWDDSGSVSVEAWSPVLNSATPHSGYVNQGGSFAWDWCAAFGCAPSLRSPYFSLR